MAAALWTAPASAFELEVPHGTASLVGEAYTFRAEVTGAAGEVRFEWRFGDAGEVIEGGAEMANVFDTPGHHSVDVVATDENGDTGSAFFRHLAHYALTPAPPAQSSPIIYDSARSRIYTANPDSGTVAVIDPETLSKLGEFFVYQNPESLALTPEGKLWVLHRDDYAIAVVDPDQLRIESGFRLPYASQPIALALSPTGDAAYVSLMALGKLLKLHPTTGEVLGEVEVGAKPRGIAVSHDGQDVYVTRFISGDSGGEVVKVTTSDMTVAARIALAVDSETVDSDLQARGVPNYLFSVALTPDGRQAWVPGKQDNILRGLLRDGQPLTHDTTVRPLTSIIDVASGSEVFENRVDLDDRSMPVHAEFTPYGDFAILSLAGSNRIEIRDVYQPQQVFSAIGGAGVFPRATVLAPNGTLFVQATLSRSVLAYDMSALLDQYDASTPPLLAEIPTVTYETLPPQVLEGKRLFHDAEDTRMAFEGYLSCGACHFEGLDDGRVYDFSSIGEGLRNTVAVLGRPGPAQGRLNWSGNFDELQDLEHTIRELFRGTGFLTDEVLNQGTRSDPLGDPKAGLSPELDALAAYVASLDQVNPSPYKDPDGTLTADGEAGKATFQRLGCDFCHAGPAFTDSDRGSLHDVGTLTALSGTGSGEPLFGIDTPT
ncbi:MAG TPA: PKD domain-containing protein, partial [Polyangiaceae bacterium]